MILSKDDIAKLRGKSGKLTPKDASDLLDSHEELRAKDEDAEAKLLVDEQEKVVPVTREVFRIRRNK